MARPAGHIIAFGVEELHEFFGWIPWLMRVIAVDVQVEVAMLVVAVEPLGGAVEDARHARILLALAKKVFVSEVALEFAVAVGRRAGKVNRIGGPRIFLIAADKVKPGIVHVIVTRPIRPQTDMVCDQITDVIAGAEGMQRLGGPR